MKSKGYILLFFIILLSFIIFPQLAIIINFNNNGFSTIQCYGPEIDVDLENNIHTTWISSEESEDHASQHFSFVYAKKSMNSTCWSDIKTLYNPTKDISFDPQLAVDKEENLHLVWYENSRVYYRFWNDTQKIWDLIETISDFKEPWSSSPRILVDDNFNVHVVWCDQGNYSGEGYEDNLLYRCKNATNGIWQSIEMLTFENSTSIYDQSITLDNDHNLAVAWIEEGRVYYKLRYYNNGTWTNSKFLSSFTGHSCENPSIMSDAANNFHFVWKEWAYPNPIIRYAKYVRNTDYLSNVQIFQGERASNPTIALDQYGNVHIAWESGTGVDIDIWYCYNPHFPVTYEKVSTESISHSQFPSLAVGTNNIVHFLWSDVSPYKGASEFSYDIFYKFKNITSGEWNSTIVLSPSNNFIFPVQLHPFWLSLLGLILIILITDLGFIIFRNSKLKKIIYHGIQE